MLRALSFLSFLTFLTEEDFHLRTPEEAGYIWEFFGKTLQRIGLQLGVFYINTEGC